MEHWDAIVAERRALADDLDDLTAEQWATPSLCGDWTVQEVVGHLVMSHSTSLARFGLEVVRARGNFDRANSKLSTQEGKRPPADLVADLRRLAESHRTAPGFGSEAPLTDILLHGFDIRIPVGLPMEPPGRPVERYGPALDLLMSAKGQRGFVPGSRPSVRAVASDLPWSHGTGPQIEGTAADLALALSGRGVRLGHLTGPGQQVLAGWLSR
jgi:uncharacterized protein (TIGR03083 family)